MIGTLTSVNDEVLAEIAAEMELRRTSEVFLLFSLGSQFDHLIKLHLDRLGVYCLLADPVTLTAEHVARLAPVGIILSGGPASATDADLVFDRGIFDLGLPVLGICLGFQMWAAHLQIEVTAATKREFGLHSLALIETDASGELFAGVPDGSMVLQSHGDAIAPDPRLQILAYTDNSPVAAARHGHLWGVQFHPEVTDTDCGKQMLANFVWLICGAKDSYPALDEAAIAVATLRDQIGDHNVLLALSGGSDSSVVAYLLQNAMAGSKGRLTGLYIKGIDRPDDELFVRRHFGGKDWINLLIIDATEDFLRVLSGRTAMRDKRVAMRSVYKEVIEAAAANDEVSFIAQGTLYTDISESGGGSEGGARKAQIKLHHNTGLGFSLPELTPLAGHVKDTARQMGRVIGVPEELLTRHPFPGPGLVVRIEGEVTAPKLAMARHLDGIYIEELRRADLYDTVWQAGAVITQSVATATKGDDAASGFVIVIWAVWSVNGFTAQAAELPWDFIRHVSRRITNEIREVASVVYRVSDKPPATIEWG